MDRIDKHIEDCLKQLPQVEVNSNKMWEEIETHLDFDNQATSLVNKLPDVKVNSQKLWSNIEDELNKNEKGNVRKLVSNWQNVGAIAATIILLAIFMWNMGKESEVIEYSIEQVALIDYDKTSVSEMDNKAFDFINTSCIRNVILCDSDEFKELKFQLDDLTKEVNRLNKELEVNRNDPYLIKAQIKIENLRTDIAQKLITILVS